MTDYQWLTMAVSVTGAVASWSAFVFQRVKTRQDRAIELQQKWSELGAKRELFWTTLREVLALLAGHPESLHRDYLCTCSEVI